MRIVTRGDLDGLTCAVLIGLNEGIDDVLLTHPQEMVEGRVDIESTDIIANLPYREGCLKWFDHHQHTVNLAPPGEFDGAFERAPSAARLVYEYYGGEAKMPQFAELVLQTDRLDSANLTLDDILDPQEYIKLGFTIDGRSGLGAFEGYFFTLMSLLMRNTPIDDILFHPQVRERTQRLEEEDIGLHTALQEHSTVQGNVVLTDFRPLERIPAGNRFLVYALFPNVNVSARVQWGPKKAFAMLTLGHSILQRTCKTNVGELAARYGGGGHQGAGSIKLVEDADYQISMIMAELQANG